MWVSKWITGLMGTGRYLWQRHQSHTMCPRSMLPENTDHVLQCEADSANLTWDNELQSLIKDMKNKQGCPTLVSIICQFLNVWRTFVINPSILTLPRYIQSIVAQQTRPGWQSLFHGIFSTQWVELLHKRHRNQLMSLPQQKWVAIF